MLLAFFLFFVSLYFDFFLHILGRAVEEQNKQGLFASFIHLPRSGFQSQILHSCRLLRMILEVDLASSC